ncbi:MAG: hypothetical protein EBZ67_11560 [Chitinophagia bacterium]|nr:hypothetical protein [Chitinophagia bacterium]
MKQLTFTLLYLLACIPSVRLQTVFTAPAGSQPARIERNGETILPNGRIVQSVGQQIVVAPHPYGMVLSPDGKTLVTANSGTSPLSITIIRDLNRFGGDVQQIPEGHETQKGVLASVFMGLAISQDSRMVYVSGGQENKVYKFDLSTGKPLGTIDCSHVDSSRDYSHGYIGDMVISRNGKLLFALDQIGFRMIIIDLSTEKVLRNVEVGRYPFGIAMSPDGRKVYVANVGMYAYRTVDGFDMRNPGDKALAFPPFAYLSEASKTGVTVEGTKVPGLGDPLASEAFSVWTVDVADPMQARVVGRVKTGFQVGEKIEGIPAVGGSSPNAVVANDKYVFVSNGSNDCISVIDAASQRLVKNIMLNPEKRLGSLRGIIPFGLTLSPDGHTLFVAESGINAVAVIDARSHTVKGHFPVGWFPSKIAIHQDGRRLYVANAKGYGSGPNGGRSFQPGPEGSNIGRLMKGTITAARIDDIRNLDSLTRLVLDYNYKVRDVRDTFFADRRNHPIPVFPGQRTSPIKYWVFITKENRTFDEVFGQLDHVNGDSTLARFGANVSVAPSLGKAPGIDRVTVAPNHLSLARRFAIAENFYCDSDHSADGHRWLVGTYPNEWVETSTSASYGGNKSMRANSKAPGNLLITGSSSAIYPEDYNESGSIWDHFDRNRISYFNFGMSMGFASRVSDIAYKPLGVKYTANYPMPASLLENTSRIFPVYNTAIPDQYRADLFIREVEEKWRKPGRPLPRVLIARIPNDHLAGERPTAGYPYRESYMADNDLAIGRVVEYLSGTPYWKEMAIVITEDDSQGGVDHVDAHRSILMVISPFARTRYSGKVHYSFGSIFKTIWNALGIPYLNQFDATASDLSDLFQSKPDFTPYRAIGSDLRLFNPQAALTPLDEKFDWKALESNGDVDHPAQMMEDSRLFDRQSDAKRKKNTSRAKKGGASR